MSEPARRLSDKIIAAFNQACDQKQADVAELLVRAMELVLTRQGGPGVNEKRGNLGPVAEAYARLDQIRHAGVASIPSR